MIINRLYTGEKRFCDENTCNNTFIFSRKSDLNYAHVTSVKIDNIGKGNIYDEIKGHHNHHKVMYDFILDFIFRYSEGHSIMYCIDYIGGEEDILFLPLFQFRTKLFFNILSCKLLLKEMIWRKHLITFLNCNEIYANHLKDIVTITFENKTELFSFFYENYIRPNIPPVWPYQYVIYLPDIDTSLAINHTDDIRISYINISIEKQVKELSKSKGLYVYFWDSN